jgi:oligopeptide/dipeptide ABC transporter ATP-binding protein
VSTEIMAADHLVKDFVLGRAVPGIGARRSLRAVDDVSLQINVGRTVSVVGESGSGKSTVGRMLLRLTQPSSGRVLFKGTDLKTLKGHAYKSYRSAVQAVFQDPWSSLNPRMKVASAIAEPMLSTRRLSRRQRAERVDRLLESVGLDRASAKNYPHQFSGGQRQRIAIARALAADPELIVLDEPVSALDVSIRAQIMNLLKDLQSERSVAYLLIAHNLATVRYLSDQVLVMYLGAIVEQAPSERLFASPAHPYTRALLAAADPAAAQAEGKALVLSDEPSSGWAVPPGCRFHPRCPFAFEPCAVIAPVTVELAQGHTVACHLFTDLRPAPQGRGRRAPAGTPRQSEAQPLAVPRPTAKEDKTTT